MTEGGRRTGQETKSIPGNLEWLFEKYQLKRALTWRGLFD
jgi:hypothetical protein